MIISSPKKKSSDSICMLICQSIIFIHKFFCIIEIPQNYLPGIHVLYMFFPHNFPNVFSIIAGNFTLLSCNQNTLIKHFFCFVLKSGKKLKFSYFLQHDKLVMGFTAQFLVRSLLHRLTFIRSSSMTAEPVRKKNPRNF